MKILQPYPLYKVQIINKLPAKCPQGGGCTQDKQILKTRLLLYWSDAI
jgi:hypothetical protein